jgi:membrane fusion protein (multidrug efflux system)
VNTVTLGSQYGDSYIVTSGLPPGSNVIIDNLQKLREGAPVSPQPGEFHPSNAAQAAPSAGR